MIFNSDFFWVLPELFLCSSFVFYFFFYCLTINGFEKRNFFNLFWNQIFFSFVIYFGLLLNSFSVYEIFIFDSSFFLSSYTLFFKLFLVLLIYVYMFLIKFNCYFDNYHTVDFLILLFLLFISCIFLIMVNDFLNLYLLIECQNFLIYILLCFKVFSNYNLESGIKFLILSVMASTFIIISIFAIYAVSGLYRFDQVYIYLLQNNDINIKLVFFVFSFFIFAILFKLTIFPFHFWVLDVYEGAHYLILFILAIFTKIVFIFINFKYIYVFFEFVDTLKVFFLVLGLFSIIFGTFGALFQNRIKRFWAFSGIANFGFVFLIFFFFESYNFFFTLNFYLLSYTFVSAFFFFLFSNLRYIQNNLLITNFSEYIYILSFNKLIAFLIFLNLFSLAGIPPLVGFFIKYFIFFFIVSKNYWLFGILLSFISVLGTFFYVRIIKIILFNTYKTYNFIKPLTKNSAYFLSFFSLFNSFLFLDITILTDCFFFILN